MENLRDIRIRMRAIEQTLKVTKAMKLISTAKLRKGRRMLENTEPYFKRVQKTMFDILSDVGDFKSEFLRNCDPLPATLRDVSHSPRTAVIVITSDKGLAGGYNMNIFRRVTDLCTKVTSPVLILIGSVGYRYFIHSPHIILENFSFHSMIPTVEHAEEIADYIISQYLWDVFDEIHIVYTHMFSSVKMLATEHQILPLVKERLQKDLLEIENKKRREDLHFEFLPSVETVFNALVPQYVKGVIYGAMVEAYACEQCARMAAMDEASKNAEEMIYNLRISYNRARQAGITQELSEIISGSSALTDE